jgi:hypothetical protein
MSKKSEKPSYFEVGDDDELTHGEVRTDQG